MAYLVAHKVGIGDNLMCSKGKYNTPLYLHALPDGRSRGIGQSLVLKN